MLNVIKNNILSPGIRLRSWAVLTPVPFPLSTWDRHLRCVLMGRSLETGLSRVRVETTQIWNFKKVKILFHSWQQFGYCVLGQKMVPDLADFPAWVSKGPLYFLGLLSLEDGDALCCSLQRGHCSYWEARAGLPVIRGGLKMENGMTSGRINKRIIGNSKFGKSKKQNKQKNPTSIMLMVSSLQISGFVYKMHLSLIYWVAALYQAK